MKIFDPHVRSTTNHITFVAEIGLCHNGSLDMALALIDVASAAGADAVKFQKRTVDDLATPETLDAEDLRFPSFGKTYRAIREHVELSEREYDVLFAHARARGIACFVTPFDLVALDFLDRYDVPCYKLASHSLTDPWLLEAVASKRKPVILSTGMANEEEIDRARTILLTSGQPVALLHCVSSYPTGLGEANLRAMDTLQERYGGLVGFSGHETDNIVTLAAAARGARIIERHITLDHDLEGFDHTIALTPAELRDVIGKIRKIETLLGSGEKRVEVHEVRTRDKYRRSIASRREIPEGAVIQREDLLLLNPGTGLHPERYPEVVGRTALIAIPARTLISEAQISPRATDDEH